MESSTNGSSPEFTRSVTAERARVEEALRAGQDPERRRAAILLAIRRTEERQRSTQAELDQLQDRAIQLSNTHHELMLELARIEASLFRPSPVGRSECAPHA